MLNLPPSQKTPRQSRAGFSTRSLLIGAALWTAVWLALVTIWNTEDKTPAGAKAGTVQLSFPTRPLPDFEFNECQGGKFTLDDLKGKPWVASFIFSRCQLTCPIITANMKKLHDRVIKENPDVMFVSISVDHKFDNEPGNLAEYAARYEPDYDRWKFLSNGQDEIFDLVIGGFGLLVEENMEADDKRDASELFAHSNRVMLVNEDGLPVGSFMGTDEGDMVRLRRILVGKTDFPSPGRLLSDDENNMATLKMGVKEQEKAPAAEKPAAQ